MAVPDTLSPKVIKGLLEIYIEDLIELAAKGEAAPASWIASDVLRIIDGTLEYEPLNHCTECGEIVESRGIKCDDCAEEEEEEEDR